MMGKFVLPKMLPYVSMYHIFLNKHRVLISAGLGYKLVAWVLLLKIDAWSCL